jgi:ppGpp synthetase/RelA/SpoT-type nucleotidyltranferase
MSRNIQLNFLKEMNKPSKSQVRKAGELLRLNQENEEAIDVLNRWRAYHVYPLNTFQTTLKERLNKSDIEYVVTAQRLKRASTIIDKLSREAEMSLDRMQDIRGS